MHWHDSQVYRELGVWRHVSRTWRHINHGRSRRVGVTSDWPVPQPRAGNLPQVTATGYYSTPRVIAKTNRLQIDFTYESISVVRYVNIEHWWYEICEHWWWKHGDNKTCCKLETITLLYAFLARDWMAFFSELNLSSWCSSFPAI